MNTGAVIVLYNPDVKLTSALIEALLKQVSQVVVVDNSPKPWPDLPQADHLFYQHFPENIGIAAAQNSGIRTLQKTSCHYAFLFDQDSQVSSSFAQDMLQQLRDLQHQHPNVVALGPEIHCLFTDRVVNSRVQKPVKQLEEARIVRQIIASGKLIDTRHLDSIGLMEEPLFIDAVDHEWCWRAQHKGFQIALSSSITLKHRLGDGRVKVLGVAFKVGAPVRLYYQFRNILLLLRRGYVPRYWKLRNIIAIPVRFCVNALFIVPRRARIAFMLTGIKDGLLGRSGAADRQSQTK